MAGAVALFRTRMSLLKKSLKILGSHSWPFLFINILIIPKFFNLLYIVKRRTAGLGNNDPNVMQVLTGPQSLVE
jgi:hypothetical protein